MQRTHSKYKQALEELLVTWLFGYIPVDKLAVVGVRVEGCFERTEVQQEKNTIENWRYRPGMKNEEVDRKTLRSDEGKATQWIRTAVSIWSKKKWLKKLIGKFNSLFVCSHSKSDSCRDETWYIASTSQEEPCEERLFRLRYHLQKHIWNYPLLWPNFYIILFCHYFHTFPPSSYFDVYFTVKPNPFFDPFASGQNAEGLFEYSPGNSFKKVLESIYPGKWGRTVPLERNNWNLDCGYIKYLYRHSTWNIRFIISFLDLPSPPRIPVDYTPRILWRSGPEIAIGTGWRLAIRFNIGNR